MVFTESLQQTLGGESLKRLQDEKSDHVSFQPYPGGDGEPSPGFEGVTGHTARGAREPRGREQPSADGRQPDRGLSSAASDH